MKRALNAALRSGTPHPPTLPEFLRWARGQPTVDNFQPLPEVTPAELAVNRWFLHRAVRSRFAGITATKLEAIRLAALAIAEQLLPHVLAGDPDLSQDDLVKALDGIVNQMHPTARSA